MIVCVCQSVSLDDMLEAAEIYGVDESKICDKNSIGKGCGECIDTKHPESELSFNEAMSAIKTHLGSA